jgi:hypothetical protein
MGLCFIPIVQRCFAVSSGECLTSSAPQMNRVDPNLSTHRLVDSVVSFIDCKLLPSNFVEMAAASVAHPTVPSVPQAVVAGLPEAM